MVRLRQNKAVHASSQIDVVKVTCLSLLIRFGSARVQRMFRRLKILTVPPKAAFGRNQRGPK